jgi:hypothetical protein
MSYSSGAGSCGCGHRIHRCSQAGSWGRGDDLTGNVRQTEVTRDGREHRVESSTWST